MTKVAASRTRSRVLAVLSFVALFPLGCKGGAESPTPQAKQCLFDTECMSSQRCQRERDDLMGFCVDKNPQGVDAGQEQVAPAPPPLPSGPPVPPGGSSPPPSQNLPPQPGDISL
jgi:hypothetical protein